MRRLIYIVISMTLAICLISCRSVRYVPVETVRTEYKTRDSIRFDSVYHRDSVFLLVQGDTVYKYKYKYLYKYQFINKTDTVIRADSVQVPYPVEKSLTRWQSLRMEIGGWAIGLIVILVLIVAGRLVYKWKVK